LPAFLNYENNDLLKVEINALNLAPLKIKTLKCEEVWKTAYG
jgi:hypothetical protein